MHLSSCKFCGKPTSVKRTRYCAPACARAANSADARERWTSYSTERRAATNKVAVSILNGRLVRQPCEVFGFKRHVVAHHDDYAKPLEVRWLCRSHHTLHHAKFGPGKNAFAAEDR